MSEGEYRISESPHYSSGPSAPSASAPLASGDEVHVEMLEEEEAEENRLGLAKFAAVVKPVAVTMAIATLVAINVRQEDFSQSLSKGLSVYTVYGEPAPGVPVDAGQQLWHAVINALAIVGGVLGMTFVMLCLYKYKCMKVLYGLLIFTTLSSLSYSFGIILYIAIVKWKITWDLVSFVFCLINFGVGGVVAIFGNKAPVIITQAYLVCVSVIVCYLLSFFPEWTTWTLLVALALYDMYAVLTPYGPLKMLVELAETSDERIPGLLYEAHVPKRRAIPPPSTELAVSPTSAPVRRSIGRDTPTSTNPELGASLVEGEHPAPIAQPIDASATGKRRSSSTDRKADAATPSTGGGSAAAAPGGDRRPSAAARAPADTSGEASILVDASSSNHDSVKLGLGDFIFYSLLVSKAALFSFTSFAGCFVVILFGLVATLLLLAVFQKPLPALPISMLLGVASYFLLRFTTVPLVNGAALDGVFGM